MGFSKCLTGALVALGAVSQAAVLRNENGLAIRQTTTTCAKGVHMMIAGGCGVPCPNDKPGLLKSLIESISAKIAGSDQYLVPYNGSLIQGRVSTPLMIQAATEYADSCPKTPIVFLGYSLGGIIVMNTLCGGINSRLTAQVIAAITYGEETYRGGLSYDYGTCTNDAPDFPRNGTQACAPFAPILRSYCDSDDPKCCSGGTVSQAHFNYPQNYDVVALDYIVSQYEAFTGQQIKDCPPPRPPPRSPLSVWAAYFKKRLQCGLRN